MGKNDTPYNEASQDLPLRERATRTDDTGLAHVIAELVFPLGVVPLDIATFDDSCAWCFQAHRVQLVQLFLSRDRKRAVMVFRAPDAESVRLVCQRAALPIERAWVCQER